MAAAVLDACLLVASFNPTINWTTKQNATMAKAHQNQSFDSVKLADKDAFVFCHSSTSFTFQCVLWADSSRNSS